MYHVKAVPPDDYITLYSVNKPIYNQFRMSVTRQYFFYYVMGTIIYKGTSYVNLFYIINLVNTTLATVPARVASNAPVRVYLVFVTFAARK